MTFNTFISIPEGSLKQRTVWDKQWANISDWSLQTMLICDWLLGTVVIYDWLLGTMLTQAHLSQVLHW